MAQTRTPAAGARAAVALAAAVLVGCAGCDVGRPAGFTARSNDTCRQATDAIDRLDPPTDPSAGLRYALDRYVIVERAVSTLTDDPLPGGPTGQQLRAEWLRPARASLRSGDEALARLRDAIRAGDTAAAQDRFDDAVRAGTGGVDTDLLGAQGLTACVRLFTPDVPATSWSAS